MLLAIPSVAGDVVGVVVGFEARRAARPITHQNQEAAHQGVQIRALPAKADARVDESHALGVTDNPPVAQIDWHLEVDADAPAQRLEAIKRIAYDHCPGAYCVRNPIDLHTHLRTGRVA